MPFYRNCVTIVLLSVTVIARVHHGAEPIAIESKVQLGPKPDNEGQNSGRYNGYKVLTLRTKDQAQFDLLRSLQLNNGSRHLNFWSDPRLNGPTDVMVSAESLSAWTKQFLDAGIGFNVKIEDVGTLIEKENEQNSVKLLSEDDSMHWDSYQRWATIEAWIKSLPSKFSLATVHEIGRTFEDRTMYMVKVSTGTSRTDNKKAIFIDANIHAREWISSAVVTWMLNELLSNQSSYKVILEHFDFYFVPIINIDGYEYTHTTDRFWRKTRSANPGTSCRGVDPNRNFEFQFGGEGTSSNPCSEIYRGSEAFSDSEPRALRDALKNIDNIWAYLTFHSYGQFWLLPWGYRKETYPADFTEILEWGQACIETIKTKYGKHYTTGTGADALYGVGGASDDYAKSQGIKYTATVELRDEGEFGFVLPPDQIVSTSEEVWPAVLETARLIIARHGSKKINTLNVKTRLPFNNSNY